MQFFKRFTIAVSKLRTVTLAYKLKSCSPIESAAIYLKSTRGRCNDAHTEFRCSDKKKLKVWILYRLDFIVSPTGIYQNPTAQRLCMNFSRRPDSYREPKMKFSLVLVCDKSGVLKLPFVQNTSPSLCSKGLKHTL